MRRLIPFAELVARVERLAAGAPLAAEPTPEARPRDSRCALDQTERTPAESERRHARSAAPPRAPQARGAAGAPRSILGAMIGLCQARPSLAAPLRAAAARVEGQTLVLEVPADFVTFAKLHSDEYRDLARKAAGKPLALTIEAGSASRRGRGELRHPAKARPGGRSCARRPSVSRPYRRRSISSRAVSSTSGRRSLPGRIRESLRW